MRYMVPTVFCTALALAGIGYSAVILLLHAACGRVRAGRSNREPFISVVIAARNERSSIEACLSSVMDQTYPSGSYEVIVADDRSEDGTGQVIDHFAGMYPAVSRVAIDYVPDGMSPKKNALYQAIQKARGEIILQTDADCTVQPGWIAGMAGRFEDGIDMVAGVAPYRAGRGWLNSFVCHEYLWNVFLSAGSIVLGSGTHASARNLAFRRDTFLSGGGYGDSAYVKSGDDTLLLHRIQNRRKHAVATLPDTATHTYTDTPGNLRTLFRQRTRHMSTGRYFAPLQLITGIVVYGFHTLIVLGLALSVWFPVIALYATGAFLLKLLVDLMIVRTAKRTFGLGVGIRDYIPNEALMTLYMTVMPLTAMIIPVKWKENS